MDIVWPALTFSLYNVEIGFLWDESVVADAFGIDRVNVSDSESLSRTYWSVVAERSSLPDSSSGVSSRMWVRIPAVTLVSLSKTLNHNCFSPPRG